MRNEVTIFILLCCGCNTFADLGQETKTVPTLDVGDDVIIVEDAQTADSTQTPDLPVFRGREWTDVDRSFRWTIDEISLGVFIQDIAVAGYEPVEDGLGMWRVLVAYQTTNGEAWLQDFNINTGNLDPRFLGPSPFNSDNSNGIALRTLGTSTVGMSIVGGGVNNEFIDWFIIEDGTATNMNATEFVAVKGAGISGNGGNANHWHLTDSRLVSKRHEPLFTGENLVGSFENGITTVGNEPVYIRDTNDRLGLFAVGNSNVLVWDTEQTGMRDNGLPAQQVFSTTPLDRSNLPQLVGLSQDEYALLYLFDGKLAVQNLTHNINGNGDGTNDGGVGLDVVMELNRPLTSVRSLDAKELNPSTIAVAAARSGEVVFLLLEDQNGSWNEIACSTTNLESRANAIQMELRRGSTDDHVVAVAATASDNKIELVATLLTRGVMCE